MTKAQREDLTKAAGNTSLSATTGLSEVTTAGAQTVISGADNQLKSINKLVDEVKMKRGVQPYDDTVLGVNNQFSASTDNSVPINDLFLSEGSAPQLFSKGTLYKGIVGDEVAIGTGLSDAFNKTGKLTELMASIPSKNNGSGENTSVNGKIDININLGGSVSGDNGNVEKMFSDPKFQKQMMDMVLYKMDKYKQQQGTLS